MWRTVTSTFLALTFASSVASAQQPCTTDAARVVAEIYRQTLERGPDPGAQDWQQRLATGQMTVREVVRVVAKSSEYMERFGRAERGEGQPYERAVARLYQHVLGRQADPSGLNTWANAAQQNGLGSVVDSLINSAEYNNNFGEWAVPGSGGLRFCARGNFRRDDQYSSTRMDQRFRGMDTNGDGAISRAEWRGNNTSFNNQDWNNDGVLSGQEVRADGRRVGRRESDYDFDALDVNGNNRIERREWQARLDQFNRLDANGDNFLSRAELNGTASSTVGTSGELFTVNASNEWIDTGLNVRAGDTLVFSADGQIFLSSNRRDTATAGGSTSGRRAVNGPITNAPAGALIARIGNTAPLFIGSSRTLRASRAGRLYLGVNDDTPFDNQGQYRVTVDVN
jgi:hypothetical protein